MRILLPVALLLFAVGCDTAAPDVDAYELGTLPTPALLQAGSTVPTEVIINNAFRVTYAMPSEGRFEYTVEGILDGGSALDNVLLENTCTNQPTSTSPRNAVQYNRTVTVGGEDITGVLFNKGLGAGQTRTYSYTFDASEDDVKEGVIRLVLTRSSRSYVAELPGPCRAITTLTGAVVIDGTLDNEDGGIGLAGATVQVYDGNPETGILVGSTSTGPDGTYAFDLLWSEYTTNGSYTVVVPQTPENSFLFSYFEYEGDGTPATVVILPQDTSPVVFRFAGDPAAFKKALETEYATQAISVRNLSRALRDALRNRPPASGLPSRSALVAVLEAITWDGTDGDEYFLDQQPYVVALPNGGAARQKALLEWAQGIIDGHTRTLEEEAFQNGLAIQISYLLGRGVSSGPNGAAFDYAFQLFNEDFIIDLLSEPLQRAQATGGAVSAADALPTIKKAGGTGGVIDFLGAQNSYLAGGTGGVID